MFKYTMLFEYIQIKYNGYTENNSSYFSIFQSKGSVTRGTLLGFIAETTPKSGCLCQKATAGL